MREGIECQEEDLKCNPLVMGYEISRSARNVIKNLIKRIF